MSITLSITETLENNGYRFEYFCGNSDFSLVKDNGSSIKNDISAVLLLIEHLREDNKQSNLEHKPLTVNKDIKDISNLVFNAIYYDDEYIAKEYGYNLVCESPLELEASGNRFVSQECAKAVISELRIRYIIEKFKNKEET
jgi:hypothetical protein